MAATAGSVYQQIAVQHRAGNPPGCDPQRTSETFEDYKNRMAANGFYPDIGATESDADYSARLASYFPAPPTEIETSSFALVAASTSGGSATATSASWAGRSGVALSALAANTASYATTTTQTASYSLLARTASYVAGATTVSTSYADQAAYADTAGFAGYATTAGSGAFATSASFATTSLTVDGPTVRVKNTSTIGVSSETTTATSVYGLSTLNNGVLGAQNGILAGNLNRGAVAAYRDVTPANDYDSVVAVLEVTDAKVTGSAPLIQAFVVSEEKFKVDKNGVLYSSGSAGATVDLQLSGAKLTFVGGLFVSSSAE